MHLINRKCPASFEDDKNVTNSPIAVISFYETWGTNIYV